MNKKMISALFILVMFQLMSGAVYARKCKKCVEYSKNHKECFVSIGIACRNYTEPTCKKNGKTYGVYKCQFGHKYYDEIN